MALTTVSGCGDDGEAAEDDVAQLERPLFVDEVVRTSDSTGAD